MTRAFVALGANLPGPMGEPRDTLRAAVKEIERDGLLVVRQSEWYRTPAFPPGAGPDFVNAVVAVDTPLDAAETLECLHAIERRLGRTRTTRWAARLCDLDLLAWGDLVCPDASTIRRAMQSDGRNVPTELYVPHPSLHVRAFVLVPLADIAPDWRHPVLGLTVSAMVAALPKDEREAIQALSAPGESGGA